MTDKERTCSGCGKPFLKPGGCTPVNSPDCWTVTHKWDNHKQSWRAYLRSVPDEATE